ncbi:MAG TPA: non-canonical purine NTP pyrophosphatase [Burkholderiaceae bacterium]|jgi:XTP/dITP diphosphohydrolase|nr:non-canonical purine NTP pyrophosphatase [Burkholderiaceae bacterium]
MRLVLASNNAKKLAELQLLFAPLDVEIVAQGTLGVAEADEPHHTFIENALAKARHAAAHTGSAAIADDSGLCVAALGGAPGVASAHYAAVPIAAAEREARRAEQDAANNALLLHRLQGVTDRRARYVSVLVALRGADDPEPLVTAGRWEGEVLAAPRGGGGFGYDPLIHIRALGRSVAELDAATKNAHSHRALAAGAMLAAMREAWQLG